MAMTVGKAAAAAGVTIRALHHYEAEDLLKPSGRSESGYALYNDADLARLRQILFFRELDFGLEEIRAILDDPDFNEKEAMKRHAEYLRRKRDRLDGLIGLAERIIKGEKTMSFKEFDMSDIENAKKEYGKEAEDRWGGTAVYAESMKRTGRYTKDDWRRISEEAERIYAGFAAILDKPAASPEAQKLVADWQAHITRNFYECTDEILAGLGAAYAADERFEKNIDKYGKGLAKYISAAIACHCTADGA